MADIFNSSRIAQILVICISLLHLGAAGVNATDCNYAASCTDMSLTTTSVGPLLTGSCPNCQDDVLTTAAINLNQRVSNIDGSLECSASGGNFAASCSDSALSGSTLSASCLDTSGSSVSTSLDLNDCIGNINGNLLWCVGTNCNNMGAPLLAFHNVTQPIGRGSRNVNVSPV